MKLIIIMFLRTHEINKTIKEVVDPTHLIICNGTMILVYIIDFSN